MGLLLGDANGQPTDVRAGCSSSWTTPASYRYILHTSIIIKHTNCNCCRAQLRRFCGFAASVWTPKKGAIRIRIRIRSRSRLRGFSLMRKCSKDLCETEGMLCQDECFLKLSFCKHHKNKCNLLLFSSSHPHRSDTSSHRRATQICIWRP